MRGAMRERVRRRTADQDLLEAAIERRRHARRSDGVIFDVERHFEIALDAIERSDEKARHSFGLLAPRGGTTT